jgi:hypothetical protein
MQFNRFFVGIAAGALLSLSAAAAQASTFYQTFDLTGTNVATEGEFTLDDATLGLGYYTVTGVVGNQTLGATTTAITGISAYASADNHFGTASPFVSFSGVSWATATNAFNWYLSGNSTQYELAFSENTGGFEDGLHPLADIRVGAVTDHSTFGAVPEPASWALMILGFGGVGATLRRRRPAFA